MQNSLTLFEKEQYRKKGEENKELVNLLLGELKNTKKEVHDLEIKANKLNNTIYNKYYTLVYQVLPRILPKTPNGVLFCENCCLISKAHTRTYEMEQCDRWIIYYEYKCEICNEKYDFSEIALERLGLEKTIRKEKGES